MDLYVLIHSRHFTRGFATNSTNAGLSTIVSVHMFIQHSLPGEGFMTEFAEEIPRAHVTFHVLLEITFGENFRLAVDAVKLLHSRVPLHVRSQLVLWSKTPSTQITEIGLCQDA